MWRKKTNFLHFSTLELNVKSVLTFGKKKVLRNRRELSLTIKSQIRYFVNFKQMTTKKHILRMIDLYSLCFIVRRPQNVTKSSPSIWHLLDNVKLTVKILSIFVAFLENKNFNQTCNQCRPHCINYVLMQCTVIHVL